MEDPFVAGNAAPPRPAQERTAAGWLQPAVREFFKGSSNEEVFPREVRCSGDHTGHDLSLEKEQEVGYGVTGFTLAY